jgi:hypothetical protein
VPRGTTQNDFSARIVKHLQEEVELNLFTQLEFWKAPILAPGLRSDLSIGLQLTYFPGWRWAGK